MLGILFQFFCWTEHLSRILIQSPGLETLVLVFLISTHIVTTVRPAVLIEILHLQHTTGSWPSHWPCFKSSQRLASIFRKIIQESKFVDVELIAPDYSAGTEVFTQENVEREKRNLVAVKWLLPRHSHLALAPIWSWNVPHHLTDESTEIFCFSIRVQEESDGAVYRGRRLQL